MQVKNANTDFSLWYFWQYSQWMFSLNVHLLAFIWKFLLLLFQPNDYWLFWDIIEF